MRNIAIAAVVLGVLWAGTSGTSGQTVTSPSEYQWTFTGLRYETNAAGKIVAKTINQNTFLQEAAAAGNVSNLKSLEICYHINGSSFGDTIDVINPTNGAVLTTVFGFFYGQDESLHRQAITNVPGNEIQVINYVYTSQSSDSLGSALMTFHYMTNKTGKVTMLTTGTMHWLVDPEGTNQASICTGSFATGKALF